MPTYVFKCGVCHATSDVMRPVDRRNDPLDCPDCGVKMARDLVAEQCATRGDYTDEILSDAAGVMPSQVAEHRRLFPDVPITNDGRIVFTSHNQRRRVLKRLGMVDRDGFL